MNEKTEIASAEKAAAPGDTDRDLKTIREEQGLSLNDVFQATRVSIINLQALENENFKALPPPVYTRNFIRKYARAVGVDEKPFLKRYEKYLESLNPRREEQGVQKPWPEDGRRYRFLFASLAGVIVAGILVYALILYDQSVRTIPPAQPIEPPSAEQVKAEPAPPTPTTAESAPVRERAATPPPAAATARESAVVTAKSSVPPPTATSAAPGATPPPGSPPAAIKPAVPSPAPASGKTLSLVIEARELSWLRITEDRNPSSQVLLKPGEKIERTASEFFLLDIGNAGGVNLIFQGKSLGTPGKSGQVVHLRLPERTTETRSP